MIISFPASTDFSALNASYGMVLPLATLDASQGVANTIIGYQDDAGSPALRAGEIGVSAMPVSLTDGTKALSGTFSQTLLDAIAASAVSATILTDAQFTALLPVSNP